jgi:hypothetical protein
MLAREQVLLSGTKPILAANLAPMRPLQGEKKVAWYM